MTPPPIIRELTLTENHIKLLGRSYFQYSTFFYEGCVSQDPKRPYGNSDVYGDLYEIVHGESWDEDEHGRMSDVLRAELMTLHQEMAVVMQILALSVANDFPFEVGRVYHKTSRYDALSWEPKRMPLPGRPARRALFTSPGWDTIQ